METLKKSVISSFGHLASIILKREALVTRMDFLNFSSLRLTTEHSGDLGIRMVFCKQPINKKEILTLKSHDNKHLMTDPKGNWEFRFPKTLHISRGEAE